MNISSALLALPAVSLAALAPAAAAQLPPGTRSAPIANVAYTVRADSAAVANRMLGVTMTFTVTDAAPVVLALPAWSPGHYVLLWFASRVVGLEPTENGQALEWGKLDANTWRIVPSGAGQVSVRFGYIANTIDRATAWTADDFAFFLGTNVFLYPVGRGFDWPASVIVETEPGWRVTNGLEPGAEPNSFRADNYHDLVDMPFFVGRFDYDSTQVQGKWFRLAWYPVGSLTPARRERTFEWIRNIASQEAAVFGVMPFRNYTIFQVSDSVVNGGGLEHQSGQMDEITLNQLDSPNLPGLYAHEMFHAWNVKRLRPADMVPYRYDDMDPTRLLWVSEGITSYYGALAQARGGMADSARFWGWMAGAAGAVMSTPPTSEGDASLDAWIGDQDGSAGIYYAKGEVTGFLLDICIRDASDNAHSLDDVMRNLYQSTYERGRGFTAADWWSAVARAAGRPVGDFEAWARAYVDGREPLPYDSVLALAGLRLAADTSGTRVRARIVPVDGAAEKAVRIRSAILSAGR